MAAEMAENCQRWPKVAKVTKSGKKWPKWSTAPCPPPFQSFISFFWPKHWKHLRPWKIFMLTKLICGCSQICIRYRTITISICLNMVMLCFFLSLTETLSFLFFHPQAKWSLGKMLVFGLGLQSVVTTHWLTLGVPLQQHRFSSDVDDFVMISFWWFCWEIVSWNSPLSEVLCFRMYLPCPSAASHTRTIYCPMGTARPQSIILSLGKLQFC